MRYFGYFNETTGEPLRVYTTDSDDFVMAAVNKQPGEVMVELDSMANFETLTLTDVNRSRLEYEDTNG